MWASPRRGDKRRWLVIIYASHCRKGGWDTSEECRENGNRKGRCCLIDRIVVREEQQDRHSLMLPSPYNTTITTTTAKQCYG